MFNVLKFLSDYDSQLKIILGDKTLQDYSSHENFKPCIIVFDYLARIVEEKKLGYYISFYQCSMDANLIRGRTVLGVLSAKGFEANSLDLLNVSAMTCQTLELPHFTVNLPTENKI
jgi:hypothetical protein